MESILFNTDEDEAISVTVFLTVSRMKKGGSKVVKVISEEEAEKMLATTDKAGQVQKLEAKMAYMDWETQNSIQSQSREWDPATSQYGTNQTKYSDLQLKTLLKEWNQVDKEGRPIPVSPEYVNKLPPVVAAEILHQYRMAYFIGDEEVGESQPPSQKS